MTHNKIGNLGMYYDENLVTRVMTDNLVKRAFRCLLLVQKSLKRMMVSGMTDDIPEVATIVEESRMDVYCANELFNDIILKTKKEGMVLNSAVSSPLDRSKRFTLSSPGRPVHSDTVLGFSWKHSSHAAIAQRLFTHISTTLYSQVLIYTAESTEAS